MALLLVLLLCISADAGSAVLVTDMDFGGVPLWINRLAGEPSVLSLHGRMDRAWLRATNPQACPQQCDCPIQWPTALYCDQRGLERIPNSPSAGTQYLFLQRNNISSLSSPSLANLTDLRWLILDHNQLHNVELERAALHNLTRLCYLFANHNHLQSVPGSLPTGLQQLRLAHNHISSISAGTFDKLHNLTVLLLQGNRLQTIAGGRLGGLLRMSLLDLSNNSFSTVPKNLPPSVQQLYLSSNSLSRLDDDSFMGFLNLKYLRLSHCGLQKIKPKVFNFTSLVELDLSYNKLTSIPAVPTTLQYLYLEANQIQEFNVTSFCREVGPLSYSRLRVLRLDGNQMSYQKLPPDWVFCLRVLESIYI